MIERHAEPSPTTKSPERLRSGRDYAAWMEVEYGQAIERLPIAEERRAFLRDRWLRELLWYHREAGPHRVWYYILRVTAVSGGALLPLVATFTQAYGWNVIPVATVGSVVALAVALDSLFRPGDRWQHYRRSAELLKSEGWRYLSLATPYAAHRTHDAAFPSFARRLEDFLAREVEEYTQRVMLYEGTADDGSSVPAPGGVKTPS
jgi:hypothetical protein